MKIDFPAKESVVKWIELLAKVDTNKKRAIISKGKVLQKFKFGKALGLRRNKIKNVFN